jgi:very-short-patch-repair endonuclease
VAAVDAAVALDGVVCLKSAAILHGWAVVKVPDLPHVSFPKGRRLPRHIREVIEPHRSELAEADLDGVVTSKVQTLTQCFRSLPEVEGVAIADSAARAGAFAALAEAAELAAGPRAPRIRDAVARATADAANPFESVLRCLAERVPGVHVTPQVLISSIEGWARPDLVDVDLRLVLEADSFEWHGDRAALRRDANRYNALVADGWTVLKFSWEDVMFEHAKVVAVIAAAARLAAARTDVLHGSR